MRTFLFLVGLTLLPLAAFAQSTEFIPLTTLPGLKELSDTNSLAPFLSQIYKLCIGLAAVLAVLQIMRAGVLYMGGDSITEKKEARNLIGVSLAGLLLVLSPVIVFSIINPDILKLDINASSLKPQEVPNTNTTPVDSSLSGGAQAPTSKILTTGKDNPACTPIADGQIIQTDQQASCCMYQTSDIVSCDVQATINKDYSQSQYCSCKFKDLALEYQVYSSQPKDAPGQAFVEIGPVPSHATAFADFQKKCAAAGGNFVTKSTLGFFGGRYRDCPANVGIPNDPTKNFMCTPMKATCEPKK